MMKKYELLNYQDYKLYLRDRLELLSKKERGWKKKVADLLGCQASYLSQILKGKPDLTLEQAHKLNQLFVHDKVESRYFIVLVEIGRATSIELKKFFREQIAEMQKARFDLQKRFADTQQLPKEVMDRYYSAWFYSAIHISLAIPELRVPTAIARKFNLPLELVNEVLEFLLNYGLAKKELDQYLYASTKLHLSRDSIFIQRHHINWRSQSLQSVEKNIPTDLHYSTVFAISRSDFDKIKDTLVQAIESARKIIGPSDSEEVCAIALDFFKF